MSRSLRAFDEYCLYLGRWQSEKLKQRETKLSADVFKFKLNLLCFAGTFINTVSETEAHNEHSQCFKLQGASKHNFFPHFYAYDVNENGYHP